MKRISLSVKIALYVLMASFLVLPLACAQIQQPNSDESGEVVQDDNQEARLVELKTGDAYYSPAASNAYNLDLTPLESSLKALSPETMYLPKENASIGFNLWFRPTGEIETISLTMVRSYRFDEPEWNTWLLSETTTENKYEPVPMEAILSEEQGEIKGYYLQKIQNGLPASLPVPGENKDTYITLAELREWLQSSQLELVVRDYGGETAAFYTLQLMTQVYEDLESADVPVIYLDCSGSTPQEMDESMINDEIALSFSESQRKDTLAFKEHDYLTLSEYQPYVEGMSTNQKIITLGSDENSSSYMMTRRFILLM